MKMMYWRRSFARPLNLSTPFSNQRTQSHNIQIHRLVIPSRFTKELNPDRNKTEARVMQNLDPRLREIPVPRRPTLDDVPDKNLRSRTLQVLLIVPTVEVETALSALVSTGYNVEATCWRILEHQYQQGHERLQLNGLVDQFTRACVQSLQTTHAASSTQEYYVAIKIARGSLDDASKHLRWIENQKIKYGREGGMGFLVIPDIMANVKPE